MSPTETITATLESVRRLEVAKQGLAGPLPRRGSGAQILDVVRRLAYVQWDPISIVAPSHLLTLWARIGAFRPPEVERLLWKEKSLLEHWTPIASLVLTEDLPLYYSLMRRYPDSLSDSWGSQRAAARTFLARHEALRRRMLRELGHGPLQLGDFSDHRRTRRDDGEWTPASDVARMLFHLQMAGEATVVGRVGHQNLYGRLDEFLPRWADRTEWPEERVERTAAQRAIRALGTGTPKEINYYFVRGRYRALPSVLDQLRGEGLLLRVRIEGDSRREDRYVHRDDLDLLARLSSGDWEPRLSLLPPFDNVVCSQARTRRLYDFDYVREQFLPAAKRRYGTYVLPILWGEWLIGRIDPRFDKASRTLDVLAVHAEPGAPTDRAVAVELAATIGRLAAFVGASDVRYSARVPDRWRSALR